MIYVLKPKIIVSLRVFYYRPDYKNLIQEFAWQFEDYKPKYPRVNRFLNHWRENIDAVIADIEMAVDLGMLELVDEDLALCSYVCPSKYDYSSILMDNLNTLYSEQ